MILVLDAVAVALGLGILTRGRVAALARLKLKSEAILLSGLLAQILLPRLIPQGLVSDKMAVWLFWGLPSVLVLVALLMNWRSTGALMAGIGVGLNILVVMLNSGMPVAAAAGASAGFPLNAIAAQIQASWLHVPVDATTRLRVLVDTVPIAGPVWHRGMASLGDLLLAAGVAHVVFTQMHASE